MAEPDTQRPDGKDTPGGRRIGRAAATGIGLGAALVGGAAIAGVGLASKAAARTSRAYAVTDPDRVHVYPFEATREVAVPASDGLVLHAEVDEPEGTGPDAPTVVLVHGFVLNLSSWIHQRVALVEAGYRVVSYDQRNHGRSEAGDLERCTIDQLGKDLRAVLDATTPEGPVVLVGHSMGGMTIMSFAMRYPELTQQRVAGAALIATSAGGDGVVRLGLGLVFDRAITMLGPGVLGNLGRREGLWGGLRAAGRGIESRLVQHYAFGEPMPTETLRAVATMIFGTRLEAIGAFLPELDGLDVREALPGLRETPVVIVSGGEDRLIPAEHSETLARELPAAETVVVPEAGHLVQLESPDVVTEAVLGLLERTRGDDPQADADRAARSVPGHSA
ncbi:alpha/beta fold hydrolase [Janibacter corallicola]|uniref:alpha/beta fold hydrolase n=1 Tax=Janibacter corallicola TaxID=415212 RepID=UPI0008354228|nr:alpha/beta hydrolase [Janibacter corallicola]